MNFNYKKLVTLCLVAFLFVPFANAQHSKGFNYQAIVKDANGNKIAEKQIGVKISLQNESGTVYYAETHKKKTTKQGVLSLVIGKGTSADTKTINDVKWNEGDVYVQLAIDTKGGTDYKDVGAPTMLQSVPYALYAEQSGRLVQSKTNANDEDPIFEVKNKKGETVFAVYQDGATVFVNEAKDGKAARGGFAVATRSLGKAEPKDMFTVTGDNNVKILIDENDGTKAARGGFAVAKRNLGKAEPKDMFTITGDNKVKVLIGKDGAKAARGGFAVAKRNLGKNAQDSNLMTVNGCQTVFNICDNAEEGFVVRKVNGDQTSQNLLEVKPSGDVQAHGDIGSTTSSMVHQLATDQQGNAYKWVNINGYSIINQNLGFKSDSVNVGVVIANYIQFSNVSGNNAYYDAIRAKEVAERIIAANSGVYPPPQKPNENMFKALFVFVKSDFEFNTDDILTQEQFAKLVTIMGNTWGDDFDGINDIGTAKTNIKKYPQKKIKITTDATPGSTTVTAIEFDNDYTAPDDEVASWWYFDDSTGNVLGLCRVLSINGGKNYKVVLTPTTEKTVMSSLRLFSLN